MDPTSGHASGLPTAGTSLPRQPEGTAPPMAAESGPGVVAEPRAIGPEATATSVGTWMRTDTTLDAVDPRPAVLRPVPPAPRRPWYVHFVRSGFKISAVLALFWGLAFNLSEVRGSSMMPGIHDRDRVLVDQLTYLVSEVDRGDIVVLRYPLDPSLDYIKRVVAVPGDEVYIADGRLWVNGEEVPEPYLDERRIDRFSRLTTTVRPGHYFVLGDNRARSSDSREFGQVPFGYLRGKVRARLWPMDRIGAIQ